MKTLTNNWFDSQLDNWEKANKFSQRKHSKVLLSGQDSDLFKFSKRDEASCLKFKRFKNQATLTIPSTNMSSAISKLRHYKK